MQDIENSVIRACFQETYRDVLGFATHAAAAEALHKKNSRISIRDGSKYCKGQYTALLSKISEAALDILADHRDAIAKFYDRQDTETCNYLSYILMKYRSVGFKSASDSIFTNWKKSYKRGHDAFRSGIYQIYRRYKPVTLSESARNSDPNEHVVICELLVADADTMECALITCQRNIYRGTLYINREGILYGIVQRPIKDNMGFHQRFFCLKLERTLPMYSAVMVKTGDTTGRPVSAECFYVGVPREIHKELYDTVEAFLNLTKQQTLRVEKDSLIMDYISGMPPKRPRGHKEWESIRFVKDFPALAYMAIEKGTGKALFREPSRTLSAGTISNVCTQAEELGVFRHSTFGQPTLAAAGN